MKRLSRQSRTQTGFSSGRQFCSPDKQGSTSQTHGELDVFRLSADLVLF